MDSLLWCNGASSARERGAKTASRRRRPLIVPLLAGLLVVAVVGCANDSESTPSSAIVDADAATDDTISPLIITALGPNPTPFKGTDEQFHVAYELAVLNFAPAPATITGLETIAPDGTTITSLDEQEIAARTMLVADYSGAQPAVDGTFEIASGKTAILVLDDVYPSRGAVPDSVTHRITARFGTPESGEGAVAVLWPDEITQVGGVVTPEGDAVQIGAPLAGPDWVVNNGCCTLNAHRNVVLPVAGRINGAERFALDLSRIDVRGIAAGTAGDPYVDGDPTKNEDNRSYGEPVLAVADGTVVSITADVPDTAPGTLPLGPGFTLANLGGNSVVLELEPDLYAVYYHLAPGSPTVQVGDRVTKGDVIAELGNSGNTSAAHLHFQLSRSPLIFSSDSVAFVLDEVTVVGSLDATETGLVTQPAPGPRRDVLPLASNVVDFPGG